MVVADHSVYFSSDLYIVNRECVNEQFFFSGSVEQRKNIGLILDELFFHEIQITSGMFLWNGLSAS